MSKKPISLFEHVKNVNQSQKADYWETITESDKKTWSTYMINRFLSMYPNFVEVVNLMQPYTNGILTPKDVYKFYINVIPKGRRFAKYIKAKKKDGYQKELIEIIAEYFEVSNINAEEYLEMMPKEEIESILSKYGNNEKEIKKLMKK